jgi:hypothetical protein
MKACNVGWSCRGYMKVIIDVRTAGYVACSSDRPKLSRWSLDKKSQPAGIMSGQGSITPLH